MKTETTIHPIFRHYFKETPLLGFYASQVFEAIEQGDSCALIQDPEHLKALGASPYVSTQLEDLTKPFILHDQRFYFQRYLQYENQLIQKIKQLMERSCAHYQVRLQELMAQKDNLKSLFLEHRKDPALTPDQNINWQLLAVCVAFLNDFSMITGGPGTGKTTTVSRLLAVLFESNPLLKVVLAAQTGKASSRLKESLDANRSKLNLSPHLEAAFDTIEAKTIHRLLGYKYKSIEFKHNQQHPLGIDVLVLDESSMIDLPLFSKLLSAVSLGTKVILLGDRNQLSSVEVGSVFSDLCQSVSSANHYSAELLSDLAPIIQENIQTIESPAPLLQNVLVELKRSYRFSSVQPLGKFAQALLAGTPMDLSAYATIPEEQGVYASTDLEHPELQAIFKQYLPYITETDDKIALEKFKDFRVLCATKEGKHGVVEMNDLIQKKLSNHLKTNQLYYHNKPIMITQNNYGLGLYNGDIGLIRQHKDGRLMACFEAINQQVKYHEIAMLPAHQIAFAMTIHKSQGSEFKNVLLTLPVRADHHLLNRQLIYTGVTRAKEKVYLIASQEVFDQAVANRTVRVSGLKTRIK